MEYAQVRTEDGGSLNMRCGPGKGYQIVTRIPNKATVSVIEEDGDWCKIVYNEYTGFAMKLFLMITGGDNAAPADQETVAISISKDCANALFEALKAVLKK